MSGEKLIDAASMVSRSALSGEMYALSDPEAPLASWNQGDLGDDMRRLNTEGNAPVVI